MSCKTSSAQQHNLESHQCRRRTGSQEAIGSEQAGWKTARWIVPNSVAERQTPSVGCHGGQHRVTVDMKFPIHIHKKRIIGRTSLYLFLLLNKYLEIYLDTWESV